MTKQSRPLPRSGVTRRDTFRQLTGATGLLALSACQTSPSDEAAFEEAEFSWGVASGDPTQSSVILWTRAVPKNPEALRLRVEYEVSRSPDFFSLLQHGTVQTDRARDYTVKIDVDGLSSGETLYYRFRAGNTLSQTGRTRTLPDKDDRPINLALASCANYPSGYYNAYREISKIEDLDAVIHVGDYIYEHAAGAYDGEAGERTGRIHKPSHEIVTLADYRERLAQYRLDEDLQAAHAHAPFITIWDDHETANNSWQYGADGHDPETEGNWIARRDAALQAYFEWMPMRDPQPGNARERLNRIYDFGTIASLIVIETRLTGRDQQISQSRDMPVKEDGSPDLESFEHQILAAPHRTLMGYPQEDWFATSLKDSKARGVQWQVIGNQTVMARMRTPDYMSILPDDILQPALQSGGYISGWLERSALGLPVNLDSWDGYPAARKRFYAASQSAGADLIVLSGDSHMFWANNLHHPDNEDFIGVEFATGSITSPGGYEYISSSPDYFDLVETSLREKNPDVWQANVRDHGFIHITLTKDSARARYIRVSTIESRTYESSCFLETEARPGQKLRRI